jgi:hypothetical protein
MATENELAVEEPVLVEDEEQEDFVIEPEEGEAEEEEELVYLEDSKNLVPDFMLHKDGEEALRKISAKVVQDFDTDWEASEEYRDRWAKDWRLFAGALEKKVWPFENCANGHVPIVLENISRLYFRAYGELFGDWSSFFAYQPMGADDKKEAEIITVHSHWQFRNVITDFKRQQHRGVLVFFFGGDVTAHSYYDESKGRNCHDILTPDEFVTPYVYTTTMPDYSDLPHYTKVLNLYRHDLQRKKEVWYDVDKVLDGEPPSWSDEPSQRLAEVVSKVEGVDMPDESTAAPYKILWYEGWLDLPNQTEDRWCQVIVDYKSKAILKLTIHEAPGWQERRRFDRETRELAEYTEATSQHQQVEAGVQEQQYELGQLAATGQTGPEAAAQAARSLQANLPPPPPQPGWMKEGPTPKDPKKEPILLFSHGVCIESIVGNLGLSYGRIEADFNRVANTAINQFADAGTLANVKQFITTDQVVFEPEFKVRPGAIHKVSGISGGELKNNIMDFNMGEPSPSLLAMVDKFYQYGQSAVQAPSVLSGESGKSGETYRGLSARIEQALKQLSVATRKYSDFLEQIIKNNGYLNSLFLPEEEVAELENDVVLGGDEEAIRVLRFGAKKLYERNYRVEVRADLRFATTAQKIAEADELLNLAKLNPSLAMNPAYMHMATKKALEARGAMDMVKTLVPPPPPGMGPPPVPPGVIPPGGQPGGAPGGAPSKNPNPPAGAP